jgi:hypothetical protein
MPPMLTAAVLPPSWRQDPFIIFLLLSLLLHLLLFLVIPLPERPLFAPPQEQLTEVELLPLPPTTPPAIAQAQPPAVQPEEKPQEKVPEEKPVEKPREQLPEQIVNPPDQTNDEVPQKTRLLSDRNSSTKEETVAVGTPLPSPPQKEKTQTQKKVEPQKPPVQLAMKPPPEKPKVDKQIAKPLGEETVARNPKPGTPDAPQRPPQLFARPDELLTQGWLSDAGQDHEKQAERQPPQGRDLIALAPPPRESLLSLPGPLGTPDYLPDIRQGNLTFLNTKAHRFAPFVRRVAQRVFQHLIIHQRKYLTINDVVAARDFVMIEAKLNTKGNLKGLIIQTRSGSFSVDESLLKACENGAWDENPPEEAKTEDGYIHFIFRSDINAQYDNVGLRAIITLLQVGLV